MREDVQAVTSQLRSDLQAVREDIQAAREAVRNALESLKSIRGVDDLESDTAEN